MNDIAPTYEPSDARFSLRALLIGMAVVSVLAAIEGAFIQNAPAVARFRLVIVSAIWLSATMAIVVFQFLRRRHVERQAGKTIIRLPTSYGTPAAIGWLAALRVFSIVFVLLCINFLAIISSTSSGPSNLLLDFGLPFFLSLGVTSHLAPSILWMRDARLCEAGILWDQTLVPWDHIIQYRWKGAGGSKLEVFQVDAPNIQPWLAIQVESADRPAVSELFERKVRPLGTSDEIHTVGAGHIPISEVFRKPHLRRHNFAVAASAIAGGALFTIALWRDTGIVEFDQTKLIVVWFFTLFGAAWQLRIRKRAGGVVLVRVFARRDWTNFLVMVATAIGLYLAACKMIFPTPWLASVAGLVYWMLVIKIFAYFMLTQLDLRANGISLLADFYYPWSTIRVVSWDPARSGRLVLAHGLRRIIAIVLPPQRDAVSTVLREKLGYAAATSDDAGRVIQNEPALG